MGCSRSICRYSEGFLRVFAGARYKFPSKLQGVTLPTEKSLKVLLQNLCTDASLEADLSESQALTKQLALVFDFVLRFDDLKVPLRMGESPLTFPADDKSCNSERLFLLSPYLESHQVVQQARGWHYRWRRACERHVSLLCLPYPHDELAH